MLSNDTNVTIVNRHVNNVGYTIPELGVRRQFAPRESRVIKFSELEKLSFEQGGMALLTRYFVIKDDEARQAILPNVEPEYFYGPEDVKRILLTGTQDEFLDCLDFSPEGVLEMVKEYAVSLEINDLAKRQAILEKLGLDVTKAIEIKNTKFDGDDQVEEPVAAPKRRVQVNSARAVATGRRAETPTK